METNTAELIKNLRRSQAENGRVEVKAAAGGFPKSVLETVSAFANGDGGDHSSWPHRPGRRSTAS